MRTICIRLKWSLFVFVALSPLPYTIIYSSLSCYLTLIFLPFTCTLYISLLCLSCSFPFLFALLCILILSFVLSLMHSLHLSCALLFCLSVSSYLYADLKCPLPSTLFLSHSLSLSICLSVSIDSFFFISPCPG